MTGFRRGLRLPQPRGVGVGGDSLRVVSQFALTSKPFYTLMMILMIENVQYF